MEVISHYVYFYSFLLSTEMMRGEENPNVPVMHYNEVYVTVCCNML